MKTKIGKLFMVGVPGETLDKETIDFLKFFGPSGVILFGRNCVSPQQLKSLTKKLTSILSNDGLPPIIAIDEEGGTVSRLKPPFTQFKGFSELIATALPLKTIKYYSEELAAQLADMGINLNLSPVLDVNTRGVDGMMAKRSLGSAPLNVSACGVEIIKAYREKGVLACAKHFPGLGDTVVDSHKIRPGVFRSRQWLFLNSIPPFTAAIHERTAAIMTSHALFAALDPANPATTSMHILYDILRVQMAFEGVIITDDLEMGGILEDHNTEKAALNAFAAGADMLLICHDRDKMKKAASLLESEIKTSGELYKRYLKSLKRINYMRSLAEPSSLN